MPTSEMADLKAQVTALKEELRTANKEITELKAKLARAKRDKKHAGG